MGADLYLVGPLAFAVAALLVAAGWMAARRLSQRSNGSARHSEPAPAPSADGPAISCPDNAKITTFTRELFAAQTTADVRTVVARHLPALVGTRRVWISSQAGGQRQLIVPDEQSGEPLIAEKFQEWTTSPLRAGNDIVGLLGIDSATARNQNVRHTIVDIAPLIGQALQNAQQVDQLREASLMDALTGTATRREGLARLHAELKRAQRTGSAMAVMLLDLDRFKSINDRCGHAVGDAVLTALGQTLQRTLRASDIRSRWGGEEFLIVLPDTDVKRAQVAATSLLRNIAATTVPTQLGPIGTTTSIGLTMSRPGETNYEAILHRADVALYRAKNAGRSCVRVVLDDTDEAPADASAPPPARPAEPTTLPFPDRRNPNRPDRRRVPGPGRRVTDPRPTPGQAPDAASAADESHAQRRAGEPLARANPE